MKHLYSPKITDRFPFPFQQSFSFWQHMKLRRQLAISPFLSNKTTQVQTKFHVINDQTTSSKDRQTLILILTAHEAIEICETRVVVYLVWRWAGSVRDSRPDSWCQWTMSFDCRRHHARPLSPDRHLPSVHWNVGQDHHSAYIKKRRTEEKCIELLIVKIAASQIASGSRSSTRRL